ncbi:NTP hydrolase p-loop-containing [Desulfonema limicola]|uniref:NTP hydrolase p-loop-containing n=1 Tax=Desulfonema limicola TaxID=45656 RepID=A0A975GF05_9BACT|nr:hypothetical protein [Desulfonema limicola]QTA78733.1 NTP hydrolase p-loop-containing [Desulfonema limicola]
MNYVIDKKLQEKYLTFFNNLNHEELPEFVLIELVRLYKLLSENKHPAPVHKSMLNFFEAILQYLAFFFLRFSEKYQTLKDADKIWTTLINPAGLSFRDYRNIFECFSENWLKIEDKHYDNNLFFHLKELSQFIRRKNKWSDIYTGQEGVITMRNKEAYGYLRMTLDDYKKDMKTCLKYLYRLESSGFFKLIATIKKIDTGLLSQTPNYYYYKQNEDIASFIRYKSEKFIEYILHLNRQFVRKGEGVEFEFFKLIESEYKEIYPDYEYPADINSARILFDLELKREKEILVYPDYIIQKFIEFTKVNEQGYFHVFAEGGMGKTFLANAVNKQFDKNGIINLFYRIRKGYYENINVFVPYLAAEVSEKLSLEVPLGNSIYSHSKPTSAKDLKKRFLDMLTEIAKHAGKIIIIIDGLDELFPTNPNELTIADCLPQPEDLPQGVFFFLLSRHVNELNFVVKDRIQSLIHSKLYEIFTIEKNNENRDLLLSYLTKNIKIIRIRQSNFNKIILLCYRLLRWKSREEKQIKNIAEKVIFYADEIFLYAYHYKNLLNQGALSVNELESMNGIDIYARFISELKETLGDIYTECHEKVLCALSLAQSPISPPMLSNWTGFNEDYVAMALLDFRELLNAEKPNDTVEYRCYEIKHRLLRDFLEKNETIAEISNNMNENICSYYSANIDLVFKDTDNSTELQYLLNSIYHHLSRDNRAFKYALSIYLHPEFFTRNIENPLFMSQLMQLSTSANAYSAELTEEQRKTFDIVRRWCAFEMGHTETDLLQEFWNELLPLLKKSGMEIDTDKYTHLLKQLCCIKESGETTYLPTDELKCAIGIRLPEPYGYLGNYQAGGSEAHQLALWNDDLSFRTFLPLYYHDYTTNSFLNSIVQYGYFEIPSEGKIENNVYVFSWYTNRGLPFKNSFILQVIWLNQMKLLKSYIIENILTHTQIRAFQIEKTSTFWLLNPENFVLKRLDFLSHEEIFEKNLSNYDFKSLTAQNVSLIMGDERSVYLGTNKNRKEYIWRYDIIDDELQLIEENSAITDHNQFKNFQTENSAGMYNSDYIWQIINAPDYLKKMPVSDNKQTIMYNNLSNINIGKHITIAEIYGDNIKIKLFNLKQLKWETPIETALRPNSRFVLLSEDCIIVEWIEFEISKLLVQEFKIEIIKKYCNKKNIIAKSDSNESIWNKIFDEDEKLFSESIKLYEIFKNNVGDNLKEDFWMQVDINLLWSTYYDFFKEKFLYHEKAGYFDFETKNWKTIDDYYLLKRSLINSVGGYNYGQISKGLIGYWGSGQGTVFSSLDIKTDQNYKIESKEIYNIPNYSPFSHHFFLFTGKYSNNIFFYQLRDLKMHFMYCLPSKIDRHYWCSNGEDITILTDECKIFLIHLAQNKIRDITNLIIESLDINTKKILLIDTFESWLIIHHYSTENMQIDFIEIDKNDIFSHVFNSKELIPIQNKFSKMNSPICYSSKNKKEWSIIHPHSQGICFTFSFNKKQIISKTVTGLPAYSNLIKKINNTDKYIVKYRTNHYVYDSENQKITLLQINAQKKGTYLKSISNHPSGNLITILEDRFKNNTKSRHEIRDVIDFKKIEEYSLEQHSHYSKNFNYYYTFNSELYAFEDGESILKYSKADGKFKYYANIKPNQSPPKLYITNDQKITYYDVMNSKIILNSYNKETEKYVIDNELLINKGKEIFLIEDRYLIFSDREISLIDASNLKTIETHSIQFTKNFHLFLDKRSILLITKEEFLSNNLIINETDLKYVLFIQMNGLGTLNKMYQGNLIYANKLYNIDGRITDLDFLSFEETLTGSSDYLITKTGLCIDKNKRCTHINFSTQTIEYIHKYEIIAIFTKYSCLELWTLKDKIQLAKIPIETRGATIKLWHYEHDDKMYLVVFRNKESLIYQLKF